MNEHEKHLIEYFLLGLSLFIFLILFMIFRYNKMMLLLLSGVGSVSYVFWGVLHHVWEGRDNHLVIAEYVLMGFLVFILLATIITL